MCRSFYFPIPMLQLIQYASFCLSKMMRIGQGNPPGRVGSVRIARDSITGIHLLRLSAGKGVERTILRFIDLTKSYADQTVAVDHLNLSIERGEFVVLIGPSGCGKSTTLRMVNRLVEPTSGTIEIDQRDARSYPPVELRRRLGYVIQQIGLMPHLTIAENISFVLKLQRIGKVQRRARARELLKLADLDPDTYLDRYPVELSGGQQQRVGVLRALAHNPEIILMDEPFGALDPITREQLQDELKRLQRSVQKTILFVTHDMDEALRLADRIVVMKGGHIVQVAAPDEILRNPADEFVANFIGRQRMLGRFQEMDLRSVNACGVDSEMARQANPAEKVTVNAAGEAVRSSC